MKRKTKKVAVMIISALVFYYLLLPPINLYSPLFWVFIVCLIFIFVLINIKIDKDNFIIKNNKIKILNGSFLSNEARVGIIVIGCIIGGIIIINMILSPIFQSKKYANLIEVKEDSDFNSDVKAVDFTKIPLLDKDSSRKLGDRQMGQMTDLVSQYVVSDLYTQINYKEDIVRVTPLEYANVIKYFLNHKNGIEGYITVNSVTGDSNLVRLEKGMKYSPSALFFDNLKRQLRIQYPTTMFGQENFEIDDEGKPFWVVPTIKYTGIGMREEVTGVVVLNAIDGSSERYDIKNVPTWIDHVYNADLIIEQLNYWGEYNNGFLNSIFGQKNVVNTTTGYTYLAMNNDIYMYTGITSVSTDQSNIGFILTNLRTKETHLYNVAGAEEYSAMATSEGLVQEKGYKAQFPLLINLNNRATYLLSLKDQAGLVKMYSFVDVEDYQKVSVSDVSLGIKAAAEKYLKDFNFDSSTAQTKEDTITVKIISSAIIDGNTNYYIIDTKNNLYSVSIKIEPKKLPFVQPNDILSIKYTEGQINQITQIN